MDSGGSLALRDSRRGLAQPGDFEDAADIDERDQRARHDQEHQSPPALVERADRQIPFGDEAGRCPGVPTRPKPAIVNAAIVSGILRPMPASSSSCTVPSAIEDRADREEQRGLHQRVIDDMDEAAGQPGLVGERRCRA